ncbi:DUF4489 domain-containing protein [Tepidibacter sp. Z1-5]|uniref:DUF4489 domain-containing protein n=1 Tax=Tepidibacter sp. Z1-5 TaxID=3134138 RepID=UPI0030C29D40
MSTYCNTYKKDDCNCYDKKKYDHCDYHHHDHHKTKDCGAILECGKEIFRSLPPTLDALRPATPDTPIPLAEVTIDTTRLYKPRVKIEYSSLIKSVLVGCASTETPSSIVLTFRLVRKCKNEDEESLRLWTYERSTTDDVLITDEDTLTTEDTFTVTFCECLDRPCCDDPAGKCCTYTLQLVKVDIAGTNTPTYAINEKDISAIAACPSCIY